MHVHQLHDGHGTDQEEQGLGDVAQGLYNLDVQHITQRLIVRRLALKARCLGYVGRKFLGFDLRHYLVGAKRVDDPQQHSHHQRDCSLVDAQRMLQGYREIAYEKHYY